MSVCIVIPARLSSSRLPEKPLAMIGSKTMIQHVYERALEVKGVDRVIVATDSPRIIEVIKKINGNVQLTPELASGTDRVAYIAERSNEDIFINLQGDEPMLNHESVEGALELVRSQKFELATTATPIRSSKHYMNKNVVKVLVDQNFRAIYFSRYPIPYSRLTIPDQGPWIALHHMGLYVYRRELLLKLKEFPQTELEKAESLEQLRALEHGIAIGVFKTNHISYGVDTAEDLEFVRGKMLGLG